MTKTMLTVVAALALLLAPTAVAQPYGSAFQVCAEDPPNTVLLVAQFQVEKKVTVTAYDSRDGYMGTERIPAGGNGLWTLEREGPQDGGLVDFYKGRKRGKKPLITAPYDAVDCDFG